MVVCLVPILRSAGALTLPPSQTKWQAFFAFCPGPLCSHVPADEALSRLFKAFFHLARALAPHPGPLELSCFSESSLSPLPFHVLQCACLCAVSLPSPHFFPAGGLSCCLKLKRITPGPPTLLIASHLVWTRAPIPSVFLIFLPD